MTRENKVALVVGFALILFVGILISDHFSVARAQEAANLIPAGDPTDPRHGDPTLLDFRSSNAVQAPFVREPATVSDELPVQTNTGEEPLVVGPRWGSPVSLRDPLQEQRDVVQMPDLQAPQLVDTRAKYRMHVVQPNESLTSICDAYYGDTTLVKKLAAYNDVSNPDILRRGQSLRIPEITTLVHNLSPAMTAGQMPTSTPTPPVSKTYTVKSGDTLSEIAKKTMGNGRKWHQLYMHNEDVIDDPDALKVGTTLRIPE